MNLYREEIILDLPESKVENSLVKKFAEMFIESMQL